MNARLHIRKMPALGTEIVLKLVTKYKDEAEQVFALAWDMVQLFENKFSRFLPESELTWFNESAGKKVSISSQFKDILCKTYFFSDITNGYFNPFILPELQNAGYENSIVPKDVEIPSYRERQVVDIEHLILSSGKAYIPHNTALDLGGIGKGYIADILADMLPESIDGFVFSLGNDTVIGGMNKDGKPWNIPIPLHESGKKYSILYSVPQDRYGFSISEKVRYAFGSEVHHLIDPKTKKPILSPYTAACVAAPNAMTADVLASYLLFKGPDVAQDLVASRIIYGVLLESEGNPPIAFGKGFTQESQKI